MPDSTEYYGYLKIFYRIEELSNWNIVRGPSFPFILYIITILFSNSSLGLLLGTYIFYLLVILASVFILNKTHCEKVSYKIAMYMLLVVLVFLNPILIGYMHALLTEFSVMPTLLISSIIGLLWIKKGKRLLNID